jgi:hypothetical protein
MRLQLNPAESEGTYEKRLSCCSGVAARQGREHALGELLHGLDPVARAGPGRTRGRARLPRLVCQLVDLPDRGDVASRWRSLQCLARITVRVHRLEATDLWVIETICVAELMRRDVREIELPDRLVTAVALSRSGKPPDPAVEDDVTFDESIGPPPGRRSRQGQSRQPTEHDVVLPVRDRTRETAVRHD